MVKNANREKINPHFASKKGAKPTWGTYENSKRNWRKAFMIKANLFRVKKHSKPKTKDISRDTIREYEGE